MRNSRYFLPHMYTRAEKAAWVKSLFSMFLETVVADSEEMTLFESGWVWLRAKFCDCRHIRRPIGNQLHLGGHSLGTSVFNKKYKALFKNVIHDPSRFLRKGWAKMNMCVLAALILNIRIKTGEGTKNLTQACMAAEIELINYSGIITAAATGIPAKKLPLLEKRLTPIPSNIIQRFRYLEVFRGVCINLYEIRSVAGGEHRLFPVSLGSEYRAVRDVFQLDLVLDHEDYREAGQFTQTDMPNNHVLLVSSMQQLLHRFHPTLHLNRYRVNTVFCRACFWHTNNYCQLLKHFDICSPMSRTSIGRRSCKNVLAHVTHSRNTFTGKLTRNGLTFRRADLKMLIKPLSLAVMDYESVQRSTTDIDSLGSTVRSADGMGGATPSNAVSTLPVISVAWAYKSNYVAHELPPTLKQPRFLRVRDDQIDGEKHFYISMLLKLRMDLLFMYLWMNDILARDPGPPPYNERPTHLKNAYANIPRCQLCGKKWGQKCYSER